MTEHEELIALLVEQRRLLREGHELLADLRAAIREAKLVRDNLPSHIEDRLGTAVKEGLDRYANALEVAIAGATQAAYDRFDVLAAICLGEDPPSVRVGKRTIPDLLRMYIETKGLPWRLVPLEEQEVPPAFKKGSQ